MTIWGRSLGLQAQFIQGAMVNCPLVRKSQLVEGNGFYGVTASASVGVGASAAVFANKRGGICTITGINAGIGAAISADYMEIRKD